MSNEITQDKPATEGCAAAAGYVIEKDSISETLLEIAAKHGNKASIDIVAAYAAQLTDAGRDALIRAIGEGYSPTRLADYSHTPRIRPPRGNDYE
jgi:hypothetical protein